MVAKINKIIKKLKDWKIERFSKDNPDFKNASTANIPISISVIRVSLGILLWQYRHLPFKNKKENMGTKSLFWSCVLQEKQIDRPLKKGKPVLYLLAITAIKLPITEPNKNMSVPKKYCIYLIVSHNICHIWILRCQRQPLTSLKIEK